MRSGWLRHHVSEANPERTALAVPALNPGCYFAHVVAAPLNHPPASTRRFGLSLLIGGPVRDKGNVTTLFYSTRA